MERAINFLIKDGYAIIPNDELTQKLHPKAVTFAGYNITLILFEECGRLTALITKPNKTKKWYYQKSFPQIMSALNQTRSFYEWR